MLTIKKHISLVLFLNTFFFIPQAHAEQYEITSSVNSHGSLTPATAQLVDSGSNFTFTATPDAHYMVQEWKVDGHVSQTGGVQFTLNNVMANHHVEATIVPRNLLYVSGANSYLYYSMDNGLSWHTTPMRPNVNNAIDEVFATDTAIYVVTTSKYAFYSMNNGTSWNSTNFVPDYGKIRSIFVTPANTIYVGTHLGNIFSSTDSGATWTQVGPAPSAGQPVNGLYINNNALYVASSDGNVYYSPDGAAWTAINGSPDGSAIRSVYLANNQLYVNTANQYVFTSPNLTGGGSWSWYAQSSYSLFVNDDASHVDVATQDGHVYSLNMSTNLGFVSYTPLNSIFYLG